MKIGKEKLRYIIQYHFDKGNTPSQTAGEICEVYGSGTVSAITAKRWFKKFRSGEQGIKDEKRSGRPITSLQQQIFEKIKLDKHISTYQIAKDLNINQKTVWNNLKRAGYRKQSDVWFCRTSQKPSDQPSDKQADQQSDKQADQQSDKQSDRLSDIPADKPSDKISNEPSDQPFDRPSDEPSDKPTDQPFEVLFDQPFDETETKPLQLKLD